MKDNTHLDQSNLLPKETKYKDYDFILKVVINISLASAYSGYCLGYFNAINFDDTIQIFQIQADRAFMQGLLSFCIPLGAAFGGYSAKFLLQNYSRRSCFIKVAFISTIATLLLQTKLLPLLFICRIIQGITVGVSTVLRSTYIKQFVPLEIAAQLGVVNQVFFAVGLIFAFALTYLLEMLLSAQQYWRMVYLLPIIFLAIQTYNLIYNYPYETAKYLLEQGREEEAKELIGIIYKPQFIDERITQLKKLLNIINKDKGQQMREVGQIAPYIQKSIPLSSNKIAIMAAYHISTLQQLSGIQVIIIYAGEIMLSINPSLQKTVPLILQIEGLVATLFTIKLMNTYGRKQLMQFGLSIMGTSLVVISLSFYIQSKSQSSSSFFWNVIIVTCLFICRGIFSLSIGPIVWLYLPEIVEPHTTGIVTMANWLSAAFVSFIYPVAVQLAGNPSAVFLAFAIYVAYGYFLNENLLVETKGKAEWEIRKEYDDKLQKKR